MWERRDSRLQTKIVTAAPCTRSSALKARQAPSKTTKTENTNYEKKSVNTRGHQCDCAWRLCPCPGTTWPWWSRMSGLARSRIRPAASNRELEPDLRSTDKEIGRASCRDNRRVDLGGRRIIKKKKKKKTNRIIVPNGEHSSNKRNDNGRRI